MRSDASSHPLRSEVAAHWRHAVLARCVIETKPLVGCSQNPLTTRFLVPSADYPQVKRGSTHSRSESVSAARRGARHGKAT
jgi:hypothetical protein